MSQQVLIKLLHKPEDLLLAVIRAPSSGLGSVELKDLGFNDRPRDVYVFVGHGSRDPETHGEFVTFVSAYQDWLAAKESPGEPGISVVFGYMELAQPSITDVLAGVLRDVRPHRVIVIPISLFAAGHVKNELPLHIAAFSKQDPTIKWVITKPLGLDPLMVRAVRDGVEKLTQDGAAWTRAPANSGAPDPTTALVVVGRGTSDPDANSTFYQVARLIAEDLQILKFYPCFIGVTEPKLDETLKIAIQGRTRRVLVIPYFLFQGVLVRRIEAVVREFSASHSWIEVSLAEPLGSHPFPESLFCLIELRVHQALHGGEPLPCTHCKYRVPLDRVAGEVKGLDALLYSVRHSLTHKEALPHSHAPLKKHLLVCSNIECVQKGAAGLVPKIRRMARSLGIGKELKVTKTSCLGRCGEGPNVVVYPDGIWYRDFTEDQVEDLFKKHLFKGELLREKIDLVMDIGSLG